MSQPVVALVLAAGLGLRYGGPTPKPALKLTGRALIAMSVEAMAAGGCTHAVVVTNPAGGQHYFKAALASSPIPVFMTPGGTTRQGSALKGLQFIRDEPSLAKTKIVLIHDAVRPMVPAHVVHSVIQAVRAGASAVTPAVAVTDSIRLRNGDHSTEPIDRSKLCAIQTPQGFPLDVILAAHEAMAESPAEFTDDVSCAERAGHQVQVVEGSRLAMKITEPADLTIARALWKVRRTVGHHHGRRFFRRLVG